MARNEMQTTDMGRRADSLQADTAVARVVAEVQGAMVMAFQRPRDERTARARVLAACERPGFAEKATYLFPKGKTSVVTGLSIRAAEEIARCWRNLIFGTKELERREGYSLMQSYCWDVEANIIQTMEFEVRHWRDTKGGGYALTDERDIYELTANQASRRRRACILAMIPSDIQEEAMAAVEKTQSTIVKIDPAVIQKLVESFAGLGVTKDMIEKKFARTVDKLKSTHVTKLRQIYSALKDDVGGISDYFDDPKAEDAPQVRCSHTDCSSMIDEKTWHQTARRMKLDIHSPRCSGHIAEMAPLSPPPKEEGKTPAAAEPTPGSPQEESRMADLRYHITETVADFSEREANAWAKSCASKHGKSLNELIRTGGLEELEALAAALKGRE